MYHNFNKSSRCSLSDRILFEINVTKKILFFPRENFNLLISNLSGLWNNSIQYSVYGMLVIVRGLHTDWMAVRVIERRVPRNRREVLPGVCALAVSALFRYRSAPDGRRSSSSRIHLQNPAHQSPLQRHARGSLHASLLSNCRAAHLCRALHTVSGHQPDVRICARVHL